MCPQYGVRIFCLSHERVGSSACLSAKTNLSVCLLFCTSFMRQRFCNIQVYWQSRPFYAFGLGAASFLRGRRLSRPRVMAQYRHANLPVQLRPETHSRRRLGCMCANLPADE